MFQFPWSSFPCLCIQQGILRVCLSGFPHSDIHGSKSICDSPWRFGAYPVLLRLLVPRHSPYALISLTRNIIYCLVFNVQFSAYAQFWIVNVELWMFRVILLGLGFFACAQNDRDLIRVTSYESVLLLIHNLQFVIHNFQMNEVHLNLVEMRRFELLTPCLQGRCSPNWATPPHLIPQN